MPWPVYSARFVQTANPGVWTSFTVPAEKRAVLRAVNVMHGSGSPGYILVAAGALQVYYAPFQDAAQSLYFATMVVVYAGETLSVYLEGANNHATLSGYLLADPLGRSSDENDGVEDPARDPPLLVTGLPGGP